MTLETYTTSIWLRGVALTALVFATSGCRCGRTSSDSQPPLDSKATSRLTLGLGNQLGEAVPEPSSAAGATPVASGGANWEAAEAVPDGFRILKRDVDNYEIVRAPGSPEFGILSSRVCHIVPALDGGRLVGLRLFGISAGSVPDRLGLRNGDMISRVNGVELDNWENATALMNLKNSSRVRIVLVRQGVERTMSYEIR
jgi:hypothetical protein